MDPNKKTIGYISRVGNKFSKFKFPTFGECIAYTTLAFMGMGLIPGIAYAQNKDEHKNLHKYGFRTETGYLVKRSRLVSGDPTIVSLIDGDRFIDNLINPESILKRNSKHQRLGRLLKGLLSEKQSFSKIDLSRLKEADLSGDGDGFTSLYEIFDFYGLLEGSSKKGKTVNISSSQLEKIISDIKRGGDIDGAVSDSASSLDSAVDSTVGDAAEVNVGGATDPPGNPNSE